MLMVGFAVLVVAATRDWWTERAVLAALATGAAVAVALVLPAFLPYRDSAAVTGIPARARSDAAVLGRLERLPRERRRTRTRGCFASCRRWIEVAFPGLRRDGIRPGRLAVARKRDRGEFVAIYGGMALLAFWASFGPVGGPLCGAVPDRARCSRWLRAPARFGLIVVLRARGAGGYRDRALLRGAAGR